jgi:hypothetical protein
MDLRDLLRRILLANELGGVASAAYRFSDPDGPGRSGYSFGVCQFDLRHNRHAREGLAECGFSPFEIDVLVLQVCAVAKLPEYNAKLLAASATVDRLDDEEFDAIARHVLRVVANADLHLVNEEAFLHLCDYHNQFHLDYSGKAVQHFKRRALPVDASAILDYKLTTAWARKRADDVRRRYDNIARICQEASCA